MSAFVNTVDSIGDELLTNSIIDRRIAEIHDNYTTSIGKSAFQSCSALTTVNFQAATSIGEYAFRYCSALTTVNFQAATSISGFAFHGCSKLATANFPALTAIDTYVFNGCSALTTANFPAVMSIGNSSFGGCSKLTALILRSETMATLSNTNAFNSTPIKSGTGYIYVPAALVDSYKAASNWSTYAAQFRALEDYTIDGTITGGLDVFKAYGVDKYSWEGVFASVDAGTYSTAYAIGDCIPLDLGSEGIVNMQIAAFSTDELAAGTVNAPITFIAKELLATSHRMNPELSGITEGTGTIGGWEKCEMRNYLKNTIKPMIPSTVANRIAVVKKSHDSYNAEYASFTQTTEDDVWIPSDTEVLESECVYKSLFTDDTSRSKHKVGLDSGATWWLRNAYAKSTYSCVHSSGMDVGYNYTANSEFGIALGFCVR